MCQAWGARAAPAAVPQLHEPNRVHVGDLEAEVPAGEHAALRHVEGVAVSHRTLATAHIGTYELSEPLWAIWKPNAGWSPMHPDAGGSRTNQVTIRPGLTQALTDVAE